MKLRGLTPHNADMLTNLHNDVLDAAKALLKRGYFIKEEAVIAAGERKHRRDIQWEVIKRELEEYFRRPMAPQSRASLRSLTKAAFNPLKVNQDVARYLENRGGGTGNETAGYGFLGWPDKASAERLIVSKEHVAAGFHRSADQLRDRLEIDELPLFGLEPAELSQ